MIAGLCLSLPASANDGRVPLAGHPGNVCLEGERLSVALTPAFAAGLAWRLCDAEGRPVANGVCGPVSRTADAGVQPVGWYRLEGVDASGKACAYTTAAVLRKRVAPVPEDSPIRIDTANAWFTRTGKPESDCTMMSRFGSLAALAGVSGVRDRLTWGEIETQPGVFLQQTRYDDSARILNGEGLQVLQVFHSAPGWARTPRLEESEGGTRYPRDLRDSYRFCKAMAERFKGRIQAWEPWNEANIPGFGGQISDEMCSLQKASYLGFKAGDPNLTVCWNVYAGPGTALHTQGVIANAAWPYFDTYNIHSYSGVEQYLNEFATARQGACGKPLWISECGVHAQWDGAHGDLSDGEEMRQAQFVPKSYASSLFAGVSRHYFFILGNYCESKVQFGLLRHDLTPRRGYLALAATGRLLAGARPLGRLTNGVLRVYAFHARPDGAERDVLVVWADKGVATASFAQGVSVEAAYDVYGRALANGLPKELGASPVFAVLPSGEAKKLKLDAPLSVLPAPGPAACSPVVMQAIVPQSQSRLDLQAYQVKVGQENTVPLALYNLGDAPVRGTLQAEAVPTGWRVTVPPEPISLRPMERLVLALRATLPAEAGRMAVFGAPVTVRGTFGSAGTPVLSFRLACEPGAVKPAMETPVVSAATAEAWGNNIAGGAKMTHETKNGQMVFTLDFGDQDPWGYPRLKLAAGERPPAGADGLMAEIEVLEGTGTLRTQFMEDGGSTYLGELQYDFKKRGRQTVVACFDKANWVGYSRPDADGKLMPAEICGVMIGINAQRNSRVRLAIGNVRWVRF
jgi:hypothetical protein